MNDRTRRGITLSWLVLFVFSILLQYGAFASPPSALAVHDDGLFELDGNAVNGAAAGDDWDQVKLGTSSADRTQFVHDSVNVVNADNIHAIANKDYQPISAWQWKLATAPDKNDIADAFAASYTDPANGHTIAYFGLDKFDADGNNFAGFWFFKNPVGPIGDGSAPGTPFSGSHAAGDILVLASYTNGGVVAAFDVYEWVGSGGTVAGHPELSSIASGVPCTGAPVTDFACASSNTASETAPWAFTAKGAPSGAFPPGTFLEGGIDLTDLKLDEGCFTSFMAETRSSQSVEADLKDFAFGSFSFCKTPDLSTQVSASSVEIGGAGVSDTAHVSSGGDPVTTGTVDFFLCGPASAAADCTTGGTSAGAGKAVNTSGDAVSDVMTPTAPGWYCFRAEYTPAAGAKFLATSHTNSTTECFEVTKRNPAIVTSATQSVSAGQSISDSATLSGTYNGTGTITFRAYGPDDATCSTTAVFTSSPVTVSGDGTYGPVSFTPAVAGTYRWIASYDGDGNNNSVTGLCNADGETDTVTKVQPSIVTAANQSVTIGAAISDSATLSGGVNPTGTITFTAYGPGTDCSGKSAYSTSVTVDAGNNTYGPVSFIPTSIGTYRWIASYSGDGNNNPIAGACNDTGEIDTVTKAIPQIATFDDESVVVGTAISDSATLSGAVNPTGTITFTAYGPGTDCSGQSAYSTSVTVDAGNGTYGPVSFTPQDVGSYHWIATYSGDGNNVATAGACGDAGENDTVTPANPLLTTTASASVVVGGDISDTAHLSGGFNPTGTITFNLYGPDDATCVTSIFSDTATVDGNGDYTSLSYTTSAAGTYRWIASYSGDANNDPVAGACNDANENVIVTPETPAISTTASASVVVGGDISDTAHLSGGFNPTGTITFNLYGPDDATCVTSIFSDAATVDGNGDYTSLSYSTSAAGTYRWIASYSGDANNDPVAGACNDANENVIVTKKSPSISTLLSDGETTGTSLTFPIGTTVTDSATLADATPDAGGTVTYTVYTNASCTTEFTGAGTADVTDGVVGDSDAVTFGSAGTYYWQAVYSGDTNNNGATSACTDEVVTIVPNSVTINTLLSGQGREGSEITIQIGNTVTDSATLTGETATAGGTVTYTVYSDSECTSVFADGGTKTVVDGDVPNSNPVMFNTAGTFYWQAEYSGDGNNESAISGCLEEIVTVVVPSINIEKSVNDLDHIVAPGQSLTYTLELTVVNGPVTLSVVSDPLPVGQVFVSASDGGTYAAGTRTITWNLGTLQTGDPSKVLTYQVTVAADAATGDQPNTATFDTNETGPDTSSVLVSVPGLPIAKSYTGNTGGSAPDGTGIAKITDTLTYTLAYDLTGGPVHNGVITDTLPAGLAYVTGSATNNDEFTFIGYNTGTRTLTWTAATVTKDGSVSYRVTVLDDSFNLPQPLVNVASIDSDETAPASDTEKVLVQAVLAETDSPTLPPTDTITDGDQGSSTPGFGLMLVLLVIAGIGLAAGQIASTPRSRRERVRRR